MSDYTPTTEEVRDVYQSRLIKREANIYVLIDEDQANAEFDRWFSKTRTDEHDNVFSILEEFTDPSGFIDVQLSELKEIIRERLSQ